MELTFRSKRARGTEGMMLMKKTMSAAHLIHCNVA